MADFKNCIVGWLMASEYFLTAFFKTKVTRDCMITPYRTKATLPAAAALVVEECRRFLVPKKERMSPTAPLSKIPSSPSL
jgi:hypothetical protein